MPKSNTEARELPEDFIPGDNQVIVGRGKKCLTHPGNKKLRAIVQEELREYVEASSKFDKSLVLLGIMRRIRRSNKDQIGFVKQDLKTGKWLEINEFASRVVVAQAFRDALSTRYKSSKQSKQQKRKLERMKVSSATAQPEAVNNSFAGTDLKTGNGLGMMDNSFPPMTAMMMQQQQRMMDPMMTMMQQQQQKQQQHMMMMMAQAPSMSSSASPAQNYVEMMPPPKMVTPQQSLLLSPAGLKTPVVFKSSLPDFLEPLPIDDEPKLAARQESIDDFVNIFHSISLPSLEASLRSVTKKTNTSQKNAVFYRNAFV